MKRFKMKAFSSKEFLGIMDMILFDDEIILGYKLIIIIYIIEIILAHINRDLKLSLNSFLNNILIPPTYNTT